MRMGGLFGRKSSGRKQKAVRRRQFHSVVSTEKLEDRTLLSVTNPVDAINDFDNDPAGANNFPAGADVYVIENLVVDAQALAGVNLDLDAVNGGLDNLNAIVIRNLTITNNVGAAGVNVVLSNMIGAAELDNLTIENLTVTGNSGPGLNIYLDNSIIHGLTIRNSIFSSNSDGGISIYGDNASQIDNVSINGNAVTSNAVGGIIYRMDNGTLTNGLSIKGNVAINSNSGNGVLFDLQNGSHVTGLDLSGNTIQSNVVGNGVLFDQANSNVAGSITANIISGNARRGIAFEPTATIGNSDIDLENFSGNTITSNTLGGVYVNVVENTTFDARVENNDINNNFGIGFDLTVIDTHDAVDLIIGGNAVAQGNRISGNRGAGVAINLNDTTGVIGNTNATVKILNNTINNTADTAVADPNYNGEGIKFRLFGTNVLTNGTARLFDVIIDKNTISGSASHALDVDASEDSTIEDMMIGNTTGASFGNNNDGNLLINNGGNGVNFLRRDRAVVDNVRIIDNTITGNNTGIDLVARNSFDISDFLIQDNTVSSNRLFGMQFHTAFDAVINVDVVGNTINTNAIDGIRATGDENDVTDQEYLTGTWYKNTIAGNGGNGILMSAVMSSPVGDKFITMGKDGIDVDGRDMGNAITGNAGWGITVNGPGILMIRGSDIKTNGAGGIDINVNGSGGKIVDIINNEISSNTGKGINIDNFNSSRSMTANLIGNIITFNTDDGLEIMTAADLGFGAALDLFAIRNTIDLNGGRGVDILNAGNGSSHLRFGDGTNVNHNNIRSNIREGVYVINTADTAQSQDSASNALSQAGNLDVRPDLIFELDTNEIKQNGLGSGLSGTGLVMYVGTARRGDNFSFDDAPDVTGDANPFSSDGIVGVGTNDVQFGNGRVNARVQNNEFDGNAGVDVLFESFRSTVQLPESGGVWGLVNGLLTFSRGSHFRDPLARLNLVFVGNTGDSLDVTRHGATYQSNEPNLKSRQDNKTEPEPDGPFDDADGPSRLRNAQRVGASTSIPNQQHTPPLTGGIGGLTGNTVAIQVTAAGHGLSSGDLISIRNVLGNTNANGTYRIVVIDANTFALYNGLTGAAILGNADYTGGGEWTTSIFGFSTDLNGSTTWDFFYDGIGQSTFRVETDWIGTNFFSTGDNFSNTFNFGLNEPNGNVANTSYDWAEITPGTVETQSLTVNDITVNEAAGIATFTVTLSSLSLSDVTFIYETASESATINHGAPVPISFATNTSNDIIINSTSHGLATGDRITISGVTGNTNANGTHEVIAITQDRFILKGVKGNAGYTGGGSWVPVNPDYGYVSGFGTITAGNTSVTVNVAIMNDSIDEIDEKFALRIFAIENANVVDAFGVATITDNDAVPSLSINDVSQAEGTGGQTEYTFTVTLSAASEKTVSVDFASQNGTGVNAAFTPSDYRSQLGTLTFSPGETSKTVTVLVEGDDDPEANETFNVVLSNALNASISDNSGLGMIVNDDTPVTPAISINDQLSIVEGDNGSKTVFFTLSIDQASTQPVSVDVSVQNGAVFDHSATDGVDYQLAADLDVSAPDTFELHSNLGASKVIYLDFDGHTTSGTGWNAIFTGGADIVTPAYDFDGDTSTLSTEEIQQIAAIWRRVAEDFMPFDVDVTTADPGIAALTNSGGGDTTWGIRVVIGGSYTQWFSPAGGVAFLNSFTDSIDTPAFAFEDDLGNGHEKFTAEAISHEVGHTLGLIHDGRSSPLEEYYAGTAGWAPIMGVGYYSSLVQWSQGEYGNASNTEDDLAVITTGNGFGYRADDYGNSIASPSTLTTVGTSVNVAGIITRSTDVDVFEFTTAGGSISLTINPTSNDPNLDILAELLDSGGNVIASSNPSGTLNATINASLAAGTYYLRIDGVGEGDPAGTGYSDYGSLGAYRITGNVSAIVPSAAPSQPVILASDTYNSPVNVFDAATAQVVASSLPLPSSIPPLAISLPRTITFAPGQTTQVVAVTIFGDTLDEFDEDFFLNLTNPVNATIADSQGQGTIIDDDATVATVSIDDVTQTEGDTGSQDYVFTVSLSEAVGKTVTVDFTTMNGPGPNPAATFATGDYDALNGTLTFNPGETTKTITIKVNGDDVYEFDEEFVVKLSNAVNVTGISDDTGLGTILDNELPPVISIVSSVSDLEGDFGTHDMIFTVTLSRPSERPVSVDYDTTEGDVTTGGSSVTGVDVFLLLDDTGSFSAVGPSLAAGFPSIVTDLESSLPGLSLAFGIGRFEDYGGFASENDDGRPFTLSQPILVTGDPEFDAAINAALARETPGFGGDGPETAIEALYQLATGAGFDGNNDGDSTDSGAAGLVATQVTPGDTGDVPAFSTFTPDPTGPVVTASGNIGGAGFRPGTLKLVLLATDIGFAYEPDGLTEYTGVGGVTVAAANVTNGGRGSTPNNAGASIQATIDAMVAQGIQVIGLGTNASTSSQPRQGLEALALLTGSINKGTFSIDSGIVGDPIDPGESLYFRIDTSSPTGIADAIVAAVTGSIGNTGAAAGTDFVEVDGTLYFTPGHTFGAGTTSLEIRIPIIGDLSDENDETFTVTLLNPVNGTLDPDAVTSTGTIIDDDGPAEIIIDDVTVSEGGVAEFTVSLVNASGKQVSVQFTTEDGVATAPNDYQFNSGLVIFAPGETTKTVSVNVNTDGLDEFDEDFFVRLFNATDGTILDDLGEATITDIDPPAVVSIGDFTVAREGDAGTKTATFVISLDTPSAKPISVDYATADNLAVAGLDYTAKTGTVNFAPGETSKSITVTTLTDILSEYDEIFNVNLSSPVNADIGDGQGTGVIVDDDPLVTMKIDDVSMTEGNAGDKIFTFVVSLSKVSGRTITVNYATQNGSATAGVDYTANAGSLTFNPGEIIKTIDVVVKGDVKHEANETFFVNLTNLVDANFADALAQGLITNDDALPSVSINDVTHIEGDAGTQNYVFTVSLSNPSGQTVKVDWFTVDFPPLVGTAKPGTDYVPSVGTLTFLENETTKTVTIQVKGDLKNEIDETFFVQLSNVQNATLGDFLGQGNILNNDAVPTLVIEDKRTAERDDGTRAAVLTVTLSQASGKTVTVDFNTVQTGDALPGVDYMHVTGQLTFLEGETTKDVFVPIYGDLFNENDETFTVHLSNAVNATIADADGLSTIVDNDPVPTFTINDVTIAPDPINAALLATFNVTLSQPSGKLVTVDYATANGTAAAGSDYTAKSGSLTFNPGVKTLTVTVNVAGLTFKEVDETFFVNLSNSTNAGILDGQGRGLIQGDTLVVNGTGGADIFNLTINPTVIPPLSSLASVTGNHSLTVNGVAQNIPVSRYRFLNLNGMAGNDSLFITGTPNSEQATLDPGHVMFKTPLVTVDGVSFSTIDVTGNGGNDTADLNDSLGNDVFTGTPATGNMAGAGFNNTVRGFSFVQGLSYAGGVDVANLYDSAGNDRFLGRDTRSQMQGTGFYNSVSRFEQVNAFADMGGFDIASLYGSTGDDTLVSRPDRTSLTGSGFDNIANRFDNVFAYAVAGGNDTGTIFDSANNDRYVGTANTGTMTGMIGGNAYLNQAIDFKLLAIIASTGHDEADLKDIRTLDTVFGQGSELTLTRSAQQDKLTGFDVITARSQPGQTPSATLNAVDYAFIKVGTWL